MWTYKNSLPGFDFRPDLVLPVGEDSEEGGVEGLGTGQLIVGQVGVSRVVARVVLTDHGKQEAIREHGQLVEDRP